ncbi:unnamed protein product [Urochloa decumbens]|uniref:Protein kinase domain-containing protein n=1 Tax=Urochloa decumbens TaxID=240449 RepID=A0ABC9B5L2_9POAL
MWNVLGQAATVAQLVGADIGGLITMIIQAAITAQQNKKECEQLARRVFTIGELLQHLDLEVLRRPEIRRPLAGLDDTLREAHELVMACQDKSAMYRLVLAGRQAERFRDVQSRIDSYLLLFPVISHIDITRRLDRIYNILLPDDMTTGPSTSSVLSSLPQTAVQGSQDTPKVDWKKLQDVKVFTFKELAKATNNFSPRMKIGQGGFGCVYMGWLPDGREVAIKRLDRGSTQGINEFNAEVTILHSVSHKHIVRLFGYCVPREKSQLCPKFLKKLLKKNERQECLLVYEFTENRSLDIHLHDRKSSSPVTASWKMRIEILLGVSRAIEYLQSYAERPVIHRDVKLSNILLDASWAPRLADFGLALTWEGRDHEDGPAGAIGYIAPEYISTGNLNPKIDVYSFGVVMLEVLTGKRPYFSFSCEEWENKREACEDEEKRGAREEVREECEEEEQQRHEWKEKKETDEREEEDITEEEPDEQTRERAKKNFAGHVILVGFAVTLIEAGELCKVLDRRPAAEPTPRQLEAVELVAQAAVRCVSLDWEARPSISEVVATLETALELTRCDG